MVDGGFEGWPAEALEFYEGLEADNSRAYWLAHKDVYERDVRGPMVALLAKLEPEFGSGRIFRPNRDVRFSADKSPYKTAIAATLPTGGYVQLSASGLMAASGRYVFEGPELARYRQAVAEDLSGEPLADLVAKLEAEGIEMGGHGRLKTAPRGYPRDHQRIDLLRHKGLAAFRQWPVEPWLGTAAAQDRIVEFLRTAQPLVDWLDRHVGSNE